MSTFLKKMFFTPKKAENTENELKAVKVAVLAALCDVSATPHNVLAPLRDMLAAPCGLLALPDSHGNSGGGL